MHDLLLNNSVLVHRKSRQGGVVEAALPVTPRLLLCALFAPSGPTADRLKPFSRGTLPSSPPHDTVTIPRSHSWAVVA
jgi:hypothetical protein